MVVWGSVGFEWVLVVVVFPMEEVGFGVWGDIAFVRGDSGVFGFVLADFGLGGSFDGALFGVGGICELFEPDDLAFESVSYYDEHGSD